MTNPPRTTALALTPLCSEPLVVLSPPGARGTRHAFSLAELCGTPFIMTVGIRTLVEQQLAGFGGGLRVEAVVDSVEAIRRLLISGVGMTIMPVSAFHDEIRAGQLVAYPIEDANLHRILILARPVAEASFGGDRRNRAYRPWRNGGPDPGGHFQDARGKRDGAQSSTHRREGEALEAPSPLEEDIP